MIREDMLNEDGTRAFFAVAPPASAPTCEICEVRPVKVWCDVCDECADLLLSHNLMSRSVVKRIKSQRKGAV